MVMYWVTWAEVNTVSETISSEELASWLREFGEYKAAEIAERGPTEYEFDILSDAISYNNEDIIYSAIYADYGKNVVETDIKFDSLRAFPVDGYRIDDSKSESSNRRPQAQKKIVCKTSPKKTTASRTTSKGRSCKPVASKSKAPVGSKSKKSAPAKKSTTTKSGRSCR